MLGEDVGDLVASLVDDARAGKLPAVVAKTLIERLVPPLATEAGPPRSLPTLPAITDHRTMVAAMHEIIRLRRDGEIATAEARELQAVVRDHYQAVRLAWSEEHFLVLQEQVARMT